MDKNKNKKDNTTKYGEFVCTEHHWLPLDKQKEKAAKMTNLTKENKEEKN